MESITHIEEDIEVRSNNGWNYKKSVKDQNYVVMSIVECQPTPAVKIFGAYNHQEEAEKCAAEISRENDFFNVYVADTNAWVPIPPTSDFIENVEYQEQRMMDIKNSFKALKETNARNLAASMVKDKKDGETNEITTT